MPSSGAVSFACVEYALAIGRGEFLFLEHTLYRGHTGAVSEGSKNNFPAAHWHLPAAKFGGLEHSIRNLIRNKERIQMTVGKQEATPPEATCFVDH